MPLDEPTIIVIIIFCVLITTYIIINIKLNVMFVTRTQTLHTFILYTLRYYLPSNVVDIDNGTAECSIVDEHEITNLDENNYSPENEIRINNIV